MTISETKREAAHGLDRVTRFQGENATMNSPILPAHGVLGAPSCIAAQTGPADLEALLAVVDGLPTTIEAARGGPPPAVLEQMAAANEIELRLRASGRALRFGADSPGRRTTIELIDEQGATLRTLSVGEAVALAAGEPPG